MLSEHKNVKISLLEILLQTKGKVPGFVFSTRALGFLARKVGKPLIEGDTNTNSYELV